VAGDIETRDVLQLAKKYFGSIPAKKIPDEPDLFLPPQNAIRRFEEKVNLPVPVTVVAFHVPESRHPDIIPLRVLSHILSTGESSRLIKSLVKERELAVESFGDLLIMQGPGCFVYGAAHLPNISFKKVERAILEEVDRLKTEEVTDEELQKAQKQLLAEKIFQGYSVQMIANRIGFAEIVMGDYHLFQREVEEFGKVTKADILRVANKYFTVDNANIIYFQPKKRNWLIWLYGLFKSLF